MPLEIRRNKDGSLRSKWWYGRFEINGKRQCIGLRVPVKGRIPDDIRANDQPDWDREFIKSRAVAQAKLDEIVHQAQSEKSTQMLARKYYEIAAGQQIKAMAINELADAWKAMPRQKTPGDAYLQQGTLTIQRFQDWLRVKHSSVQSAMQVTTAMAMGFMSAESERGVAARTYNVSLAIMKGLFTHIQNIAGLAFNPFATIGSHKEDTLSREPFTQEDINAILAAAADDEMMRPLIVCALCTGMRRGDVSTLRWSDVDLKTGFIKVRTAKTGEPIEVPILPALHKELSARQRGDSEYVFPEAAKMYEANPDGLNWRLHKVLLKAGFIDEGAEADENKKSRPMLPSLSADETRQRGFKFIATQDMLDKKRRLMQRVFGRYMDDCTTIEIAAELGVSKGTVSMHLNEIQRGLGTAVIRRPAPPIATVMRGSVLKKSKSQRLRRANVRGWHAFRTTFITMALAAGLPMELLRRITGHTTVEIVLKHYFRPGREAFSRAFHAAMPQMLTDGKPSRDDQMREILNKSTQKTWSHDTRQLLALLSENTNI